MEYNGAYTFIKVPNAPSFDTQEWRHLKYKTEVSMAPQNGCLLVPDKGLRSSPPKIFKLKHEYSTWTDIYLDVKKEK